MKRKLIELLPEICQRLNLITEYDLCRTTESEMMYLLAQKLNELMVKHNDDMIKVNDKFIEYDDKLRYLLDEGLASEIKKVLNQMYIDGTLANIIDEVVLKEKLDKKEYREFTRNIKEFGAKGDGLTDDTEALKKALRVAYEIGSLNLIIPKGSYVIDGYADIYSNTTLDFREGAEFKKSQNSKTSYLLMCGRVENEGTVGYGGGAKNVKILNGKFKGYFDRGIGISFTFNHMEDFYLRNCYFEECTSKGHTLDLAGCNNIFIENCTFKGWKYIVDRGFTECIQIDNSTTEGLSDNFANYDNLGTKNVYVRNCKFIPIYNKDGSIKYSAPNAIGSHNYLLDFPFKNIVFEENYLENIQRQGDAHSGGWVRFYGVDGLKIKNNTFNNTNGYNGYAISCQSKLSLGDSLPCQNIEVEGNEFLGFKYNGSNGYSVIRLYGEKTLKKNIKNIKIRKNKFKDCHLGESSQTQNICVDLINISNAEDIEIELNRTDNVRRLVYCIDSINLNITRNIMEKCWYLPISLATNEGVSIIDNEFNDCGHAMYIAESQNLRIGGNKFTKIKAYLSAFSGLIMFKKCSNLLFFNNIISKLKTDMQFDKEQVVHGYTDSLNQRYENNIVSGYGEAKTINVTSLFLGSCKVDRISKIKFPALDSDDTEKLTLSKKLGTVGDSRTLGANIYKWQDTVRDKSDYFSNWNNYGQSGAMFASYDLTKIDESCACYYVAFGVNEFRNGATVESMNEGMKRVYDYIRGINKNAYIIFQTPFKCFETGKGWNENNSQSKKLIDYADAIKTFAETYSIPVIDMFKMSGISSSNQGIFMTDKLHLNEIGAKYIGEIISAQVNSLIN